MVTSATSVSSSIPEKRWSSFHDHLRSVADCSTSHSPDIALKGRTFYQRYTSKKDKTTLVAWRSLASKHSCANTTTCLGQNASHLTALNESERLRVIQCMNYLAQQGNFCELQKKLALWSKTLKESLGEYSTHLLLQPQSLLLSNADDNSGFFQETIQKIINGLFATSDVRRDVTLTEVVKVMQTLTQMPDDLDLTFSLLERFNQQQFTLKQLDQSLDRIKEKGNWYRFPEKNFNEVFREFSGVKGSDVSFPLSQKQLVLIFRQYKRCEQLRRVIKNSGLNYWIASVQKIRQSYINQLATIDDLLMLLAIGRETLRFKYGIYPNTTQILTVLGLLAYPDQLKGRIAQVRTGEGKSMLITLLAFVCACQGKTVDIVSSSRYLAQRDAEKYAPFFKEFNITTSHICLDDPTEEHFRGQILYGTNYDFEFALMRDQMSPEQKRLWMMNGHATSRPFDVVIVDEVDNLFIDSALNSVRIAIPALASRGWVYSPILTFVKTHKEEIENGFKAFMLGEKGIFHLTDQLRTELRQIQNGLYQKEIETLTNGQLIKWMINAYQALYSLSENHNYILQHKDTETAISMKSQEQITIVDWSNTGRVQEKSRWHDGLHQFIETKHRLTIQEESLTVASLSHPIYFNYYQNIYGLTGTLGSKVERDEIEQTYSIDSFDVPPHRKNLRQQLPPLLAPSQIEQYQLLVKEIKKMQKQNRPILILCETIQQSIDFSQYLNTNKISHQLLNELQAEEEDFIIARAGGPGIVTIATNAAGRGTDIILHPQSQENGGLHVIFTFFPENERIEAQGFGRSARQGQQGSCRLILHSDRSLDDLLKQRKQAIELTSKYRIESIFNEKNHHQFLITFWQQLQEFYQSSPDIFTAQAVNNWLRNSQLQEFKDHYHLAKIRELLKGFQDPNQIRSDKTEFYKLIQSSLGMLAQQCWAHFFYDKLQDISDKISITNLYQFSRPKWESIFQIAKKNRMEELD